MTVMTSGLPSDEVAEDYKNSLEDLTLNSRYEISNLTIIAKENVDHALAISRVIEGHIRTAAPNRKLPALYVMDSVVKNVGTPYTLFFGRNLYQTFMNAYTLVDGSVRKKLEEMLKTWKEPVPGSLDARPVFPLEVTRNIENALIKARTAAVQLQQQHAKHLQGRVAPSWRGTSAPPPSVGVAGTRLPPTAASPYPAYTQSPTRSQQQSRPSSVSAESRNGTQLAGYPTRPSPQREQPPFSLPLGYEVTEDSVETISSKLATLIAVARIEFAGNPYDQGLQQRLKALLDLQIILHSQHLPPSQLKLISYQVTQLSASNSASSAAIPASRPMSTSAMSSMPAPVHLSLPPSIPISSPYPMAQHAPQPQQYVPQQQSIESLLPPNALAALLASVTGTPAPIPSPVPQPAPSPVPPQPAVTLVPPTPVSHGQPQPASTSTPPISMPGTESSILASLRAVGMLPAVTNNAAPPPVPPLPWTRATTHALPQKPNFPLPTIPPNTKQQMQVAEVVMIPNDVELTAASLKIHRPDLVSTLYEARPNQCGTCGRRFLATAKDKERKARHLDWHFRVNIRMADVMKRGQSRSWYVDEMAWIKSRDDEEGSGDGGDDTTSGRMNSSGAEKDGSKGFNKIAPSPKQTWMAVPNEVEIGGDGGGDGGGSNIHTTCPICQERFEPVWHDEAQEWVWMDAVRINGRVYHVSCHEEASRDRQGTLSRHSTPDSVVLGKRKANDTEMTSWRKQIKKETVGAS